MDSRIVAAELDSVRLSDWIAASGLSRSTAYELLRLLEIEPEPLRVPGSRKPASHLTADQVQMLAPWAHEIAHRGASLPTIRARIAEVSGQSEIVPAADPGQSEIVPASSGIVESVAAAITAAIPVQPADPLRRARAIADAADLGVALSSAELADVLGLSPSTVSSWPDGHSPRPGFVLRREKAAAAVWWIVERQSSGASVRAIAGAPGGRSVGFGACLTVAAVSLPVI